MVNLCTLHLDLVHCTSIYYIHLSLLSDPSKVHTPKKLQNKHKTFLNFYLKQSVSTLRKAENPLYVSLQENTVARKIVFFFIHRTISPKLVYSPLFSFPTPLIPAQPQTHPLFLLPFRASLPLTFRFYHPSSPLNLFYFFF